MELCWLQEARHLAVGGAVPQNTASGRLVLGRPKRGDVWRAVEQNPKPLQARLLL